MCHPWRIVLLTLTLQLVVAATASADELYTYTSYPFFFVAGDYTGVVPALYPNPVTDNGTANRITGTFVLSDSFVGITQGGPQPVTAGVVSYSFSDGHQTLTNNNSTGKFSFGWGPVGPIVWNGAVTFGDSNRGMGWDIEISSATGEIFSQSPNSGSDLYESASYNGTAPGCGGGGYDINHGGTNGGSTCLGGVGDIGVNTANLPSWTWTVQRVPEPTTLVLLGLGIAGVAAVGRARRSALP
ncbi:MAG: hypothetical protein DME06_05470 [Candidatus Rokuibacteriota bacterium]|nr:MAG: hypothetical protein DME06_05470 [Candidatus Rokubacteria bacterium]